MKASHWIIAAAALSSVQAAPASAGINDPEVIIYRFPGVRDDGGAAGAGVATVFHCTNFSGASETLRFVSRDAIGALLHNDTVGITHLATVTASTHGTNAYLAEHGIPTGAVGQGTMAIAATSINIICT